jgi:S-DNA-T family DNA segregation ATPase FtsK/SpoIIIE
MAADLTMQMVGVASTAVLVPILFWGWRLIAHRRLERLRMRLLLWIVGVGFAAAFASLVPVTERWPLPSGLGGVVGDAILTLPRKLSGGFGVLMMVTGVMAGIAALWSLSASCGLFLQIDEESDDDGDLAARSRASDDDDAAGEPGFFLVALGATIHGFLSLSASLKRGISSLLPVTRFMLRTHSPGENRKQNDPPHGEKNGEADRQRHGVVSLQEARLRRLTPAPVRSGFR